MRGFNMRLALGGIISLLLLTFVSCSKGEEIAIVNLTLSGELSTLIPGQIMQLESRVAPGNATNKALIWSSSAEDIATVSQNGLVTAESVGKVKITVTAEEDPAIEASLDLTVNDGTFMFVVEGAGLFEIPTHPGLEYNYDVDWNNNSIFDDLQKEGNAQNVFADAGPHIVRVRGKFPAIQFGVDPATEGDDITPFDSDISERIIDVIQWGSIEWKSMRNAFAFCKNLNITATDLPNLSEVEDMSNMFRDNERNTFNATETWDVSNVSTMRGMFTNALKMNPKVSNWNTYGVKDMSAMFEGTQNANPDVRHWNVSNVTDMNRMFLGAKKANPDMSLWNITNELTNMEEMLDESGISPGNYADALQNFVDRAEEERIDNIILGASGIQFCDFAEEARDDLIFLRSWEFLDEGDVNCDD